MVLAIETGMRFGELVSITWNNVDLDARTIHLPDTKNGHPRTVPLSTRALGAIRTVPSEYEGRAFMGKPGSIRAAFGAALKRSGVGSDLRFHDLRHEAVTRLFEKGLNPIEVGMISVHRSMSMLQRYTHLRAEGLLSRLA